MPNINDLVQHYFLGIQNSEVQLSIWKYNHINQSGKFLSEYFRTSTLRGKSVIIKPKLCMRFASFHMVIMDD